MHIVSAFMVLSAWAGDMNGDCSSYKLDVSQELKLWDAPASAVIADSFAPVQKKIQFQLQEQKNVRLKAKPEKVIKKDGFGGVFAFRPESAGYHQMALGKRAWIDVVDAGSKQIVKAVTFDMQTQCEKLVKVVKYDLAAGKKYWIQITGSPENRLTGTITTQK